MPKVNYTKAFFRQYKKLPLSLKNKTKIAIKKFESNPKDEGLKAHKLNGKLSHFYSFSVDFKTRIVFEINSEGQFLFLKIGGHGVYK